MRAPYQTAVLSGRRKTSVSTQSRPHIVEMKQGGCRASLTPCSPSNSNAKLASRCLVERPPLHASRPGTAA